MPDLMVQAVELFQKASQVCVLTGAGVSAESGIPTFRASDGLWEGEQIMDVASPEGWQRNPGRVWDFYHARRATAQSVQPNPGHHALAQLERHFANRWTLVTQNVDGLHQQAGSQNVLELHGSLHQTLCTECGEVVVQPREALPRLPECRSCRGRLRPNIVWFGEMLDEEILQRSVEAAWSCDLFLVVGTSAVVYPAAGLIGQAREAAVIEVNLEESAVSSQVDLFLRGKSGVILPRLCEMLGIH